MHDIERAATRQDGYLPLENYGVLGDGRAVALSGADGSIDGWCVPNLDAAPLFDRMLGAARGGRFVVVPVEPFTVHRRYRENSNARETVFATDAGRAIMTESLNSGTAGRLPWAELARRVDGLEGRRDRRGGDDIAAGAGRRRQELRRSLRLGPGRGLHHQGLPCRRRARRGKAALSWLVNRLEAHGCRVCFILGGDVVPAVREIATPGWRGSASVVTGNVAGA